MDFTRIIKIWRSWGVLLITLPLVLGLLGLAAAGRQPPRYESRARLMIGGPEQGQAHESAPQLDTRLANTYAELVHSYPVLTAVSQQLALAIPPDQLAQQIVAVPVPHANLIEVVASAGNPQQAADIANATAKQMLQQNPSGLTSFSNNRLVDLRRQIERLKPQVAEAQRQLEALAQELDQAGRQERGPLEQQQARLYAQLAEHQQTLADLYESYLANSTLPITIVEQARANPHQVAPHPLRTGLWSAALGLLLGLVLIPIVDKLFFTLRHPEDVATTINSPSLGVLPWRAALADAYRQGFGNAPNLVTADSYESLRLNLQMLTNRDAVPVLVVTSPERGTGSTTVAAQLALTLARFNAQVLLIDADIARPRLHKLFQLGNSAGLATLLTSEGDGHTPQDCMVELAPNLRLLPAGSTDRELAELLDGERVELLLWVLQQEAEFIIIDAPCAPETLPLMQHATGALLVAAYGTTRRASLRTTYRSLTEAQARTLGVVLNKVSPSLYPALAETHTQELSRRRRLFLRRRQRLLDPFTALAKRRRALMGIPINLTLLAGCCLMLYGGGLYANAAYEQQAAHGDNDLPAAAIEVPYPNQPDAFVIPVLGAGSRAPSEPNRAKQTQRSLVTRLVIPRIGVDTKVIEVSQAPVEVDGKTWLVWQVAKYAVGHHLGSANPGEGSNIVLAGHVGGAAPVFKDLIMAEPGDQLTLYSNGQQYLYVIAEKIVVKEIGVPEEVRRENARFMDPTADEMVTLITCWPPRGPEQYDYRVIVRALPFGSDRAPLDTNQTNWGVR